MIKPRKQKRFPAPTPSKTILGTGVGWGYGFGVGVGPFFGMGISASPGAVLFGAGYGVGAYCGIGYGAGFVMGIGAFYIPYGVISRDIFHPPRAFRTFVSNVKLQFRMLLVSFFQHTGLTRILNPIRPVPWTRISFIHSVCNRTVARSQGRL